MLFYFNKLF